MFRVLVVFNGSVDREYPFYSVAKDTLEDIKEMPDDMEYELVHAVSVQVQQSRPGGRQTGWETLPVTPWG